MDYLGFNHLKKLFRNLAGCLLVVVKDTILSGHCKNPEAHKGKACGKTIMIEEDKSSKKKIAASNPCMVPAPSRDFISPNVIFTSTLRSTFLCKI